MTGHFAVSAVGEDRPGIVAAVTSALLDLGCNLEDTAMTILRGYFAMMLVVAAEEGVDAERLSAALEAPAASHDLTVTVREMAEPTPPEAGGEPWTASIYGADHPGIVHAVAAALATRGVNIVDLSTRVIGDSRHPVYAMILDLSVPPAVEGDALRDELAALARDLGVECTLHPVDVDIL